MIIYCDGRYTTTAPKVLLAVLTDRQRRSHALGVPTMSDFAQVES